MAANIESGAELLARLGNRPAFGELDSRLFPTFNAPKQKQIYELLGEEGSGKSECLIHILVRCLLPPVWRGVPLGGQEIGVIFIDTDYHFSLLRLTSVMEHYVHCRLNRQRAKTNQPETEDVGSLDDTESLIKSSLRRLHLVRCSSHFQLLATLHSLDGYLCKIWNISAVMMDSVSAFYWVERLASGNNRALNDQSQKQIANIIQKLVNKYNLVMFATKQVLMQKRGEDNKQTGEYVEFLSQWAKLVTHRWIFSKTENVGIFSLKLTEKLRSEKLTFSITTAGMKITGIES